MLRTHSWRRRQRSKQPCLLHQCRTVSRFPESSFYRLHGLASPCLSDQRYGRMGSMAQDHELIVFRSSFNHYYRSHRGRHSTFEKKVWAHATAPTQSPGSHQIAHVQVLPGHVGRQGIAVAAWSFSICQPERTRFSVDLRRARETANR